LEAEDEDEDEEEEEVLARLEERGAFFTSSIPSE